jgi:two-component system, LuxR family, response regulator TtrR
MQPHDKAQLYIQSPGSEVLQRIQLLSAAWTDGVHEFRSGRELIELLTGDLMIPGVAVFDAMLSDTTGGQLTERLSEISTSTVPVVVVNSTDARTATRFLMKGKCLVIPNAYEDAEIWEVLTAGKQRALANYQLEAGRADFVSKLVKCTQDELKVLRLWCMGKSNKQIASALEIAIRTVQIRKKSLLQNLHLNHVIEVVREMNSLGFSVEALGSINIEALDTRGKLLEQFSDGSKFAS